jgi:hemoglobin
MKRLAALVASWILAGSQAAFAQVAPPPAEVAETVSPPEMLRIPLGEEPVDPYEMSNKNAGAAPFEGTQMLEAFHGREGIGRIVADLVRSIPYDKRIAEIFRATDMKRLERTLNEQFCFILNGGCDYTGRDMKSVHKDQGVTQAEFAALVELLQDAMDAEHVLPSVQNRFLAKLAPMKRDVVVR